MATNTTRLSLRKPATSDNVDVGLDLNDNWDKVDQNVGLRVCTSATRPGTPFTGQQIYETDTGRRYFWNGTKWFLEGFLFANKAAAQTKTSTTSMTVDNHIQFNLDVGVWMIEFWGHVSGNASGDYKMDWDFGGTAATTSRSTLGPAGSGGDTENTQVTLTALSITADQQYAIDTDTTAVVRESLIIDVTVAGLLRMFWAQNVSNATGTTLSAFGTRAIAHMVS
jgi:hypothetical protein